MAKSKSDKWLEEEGLLKLEAWARDGLTNEQIAHNMGISTSTLYDYMNKHLAISEALKKGKEVVDIQVENALFKRAIGYSYKETIKELREGALTTVKETIKSMPPDVTAQIYWLKNRKPDKWRDKPTEQENNDSETGIIELGTVEDSE